MFRRLLVVAPVLLILLSAKTSQCATNSISVALFEDAGVAGKGVPRVIALLCKANDVSVTKVKGTEIAAGVLTNYDVVIFTGGSGSKQAAALGENGREQVRQFVRNGGGYIGICAGAYLACSGFNWGVGVLNAKPISPKWQRGKGTVEIEIMAPAMKQTGLSAGKYKILYANGPILERETRPNATPYEALAVFRTELARNGTPKGIMIDAPAIASATYGKGRVLISSPHPEQTEGLENFVEAAVRWTAQKQ